MLLQKDIRQNVPFVNKINTIYVTVMSNVDTSGNITVMGLKNAIAESGPLCFSVQGDLAGPVGKECYEEGSIPSWAGQCKSATWDARLFQAHFTGCTLLSREPLMLSFDVLNPSFSQQSPEVSILSPLSYWIVGESELLHKPGGGGVTLYGVAGFNDPMQVMVPEFIISTIAQSTPVSGIVNVISVTIEPSVALSGYDLSVIRMTNLTGAEMPTNVVLSAVGGGNAGHELFCGTSGQTSLSIWNMTTSELILQLCENKSMAVGVQYTFEFSIMNPTQDQESPNIMIEARGRVVNIEFSPMTKSDAALLDVEGGASPLKVVVPLLTTKTIAQSTPIAGVINMISLTLSCNLQLRVPLSISVSGLSGASFGSSDATVVLDGYIANSLLCG